MQLATHLSLSSLEWDPQFQDGGVPPCHRFREVDLDKVDPAPSSLGLGVVVQNQALPLQALLEGGAAAAGNLFSNIFQKR